MAWDSTVRGLLLPDYLKHQKLATMLSGLDLAGVYLPNLGRHERPNSRDVPGPAEFPKNFHVLLSFGGKKRGRLYRQYDLTVNIKDLTQDRPLFSSVVTVLPCRDSSQMLTVIRVLFSIYGRVSGGQESHFSTRIFFQ